MARFLYLDSKSYRRNFYIAFLALSWCLGLCCGELLCGVSGASFVSMMGVAVKWHISFFGTLIPFLLPFLFSVIAVYLNASGLLFIVCFCKATLLGYLSFGLQLAYGSAGWLMQLLFMFRNACFSCLLFLYWLRHIHGERVFSGFETGCFLAAGIVVSAADYFVISTFLQGVLSIKKG